MLAVLMVILDMTVVNVALPHMMGALGATPDQITWVITSYIVAEAIIIPTSGFLAARFGRKPRHHRQRRRLRDRLDAVRPSDDAWRRW